MCSVKVDIWPLGSESGNRKLKCYAPIEGLKIFEICFFNPYFFNLQVQAHFGKQMPLLFLYVKESACARARKVLKMTSAQSLFLDVSSSDETQKRITILPEKLSDENKSTLKSIFGDLIQVKSLNLSRDRDRI